MHTIKIIGLVWFLICVAYVTFRCWQGGLFETGLENTLIPFSKPNEGWENEEFERDCTPHIEGFRTVAYFRGGHGL